jgi:tRNA pseudouridine13 synthase
MQPSALPYAHGGPLATGRIKQQCEDFVVEETLGFEPSGSGEHIFLRLEKQGENTDFLARQIAKFAGLPRQAVSYAGMKDRHGRTIQWFSVHLPGKREIDWRPFESENVRVLDVTRNDRKLKIGALKGNRFRITLRDLKGEVKSVESRLETIASTGVPNFFGSQRFGREGQNLCSAIALFKGEFTPRDRHLRGIYLSAARSEIFNRILAKRVRAGTWDKAIPGDVYMFADSHSFFREQINPDIERRIAELQIHPSGPLWGKGESPASEDAREIEQTTAAEVPELSAGLISADLEMERRPLRLPVLNLSWSSPEPATLQLRFDLPAGCYATTVLREIIDFEGDLD